MKFKEFTSKSVSEGMEDMEQNQYEPVNWSIDKHTVVNTQKKKKENGKKF